MYSIDIRSYNHQADRMDRDKKIDLQTLPYILITNFYGHIAALASATPALKQKLCCLSADTLHA